MAHEHESWQLQDSAQGGKYCGACGEHVKAPTPALEHEHYWTLTETGYVRTWSTEIDEETGAITAYYGGSDDFSDGGNADDHLACYCGETRPIPEGIEVDYQ